MVSKLYEGREIPWDTLLTPTEQLLKAAANGNSENENSNGNEMPNMLNIVEMEQDWLNDHECMAPMMQLIKFMSNKKIYSSSDSQLPLWMNEIKVKMASVS